jgi:tetratricopeptide (TPR) repeat protein
MLASGHLPRISDRTLGRLAVGLALALVIGIPAFAAYYYLDRHPDPGPTMIERQIASAEAAVRAQPGDTAARNMLGAAYVSAGRDADGIAQFTEVLNLQSDNRAALLGRGLAYRQFGKPDLALADFGQLVTIAAADEMAAVDPQLEQAYYEIGAIQLDQGDAMAAVGTLEKALAIDGGDADALYTYGSALIATGDPAKGVQALRRAVAFVPAGWCDPYRRMVDGYTALQETTGITYAGAMVAFCEGRLAEAASQLQPLASSSFAVDAWLGLALVDAAQGDPQGAAAYYGKVLERDPQNASALIGLAQLGGADAHAGLASTAPSTAAAGSTAP